MDNKRAFALTDQIMGGIVATDEWFEIQNNDPRIQKADEQLRKTLAALAGMVSKELLGELEDAVYDCACISNDAAILYGMRVAFALQTAAANPAGVSAFIAERTDKEAQA